MKIIEKKDIPKIIMLFMIIFSFSLIGFKIAHSFQKTDQNPIPELRTERIYEIYNYQNMIGIWCIDGYKWILTSAGAMQAYRVDGKGNSVPARCDE